MHWPLLSVYFFANFIFCVFLVLLQKLMQFKLLFLLLFFIRWLVFEKIIVIVVFLKVFSVRLNYILLFNKFLLQLYYIFCGSKIFFVEVVACCLLHRFQGSRKFDCRQDFFLLSFLYKINC